MSQQKFIILNPHQDNVLEIISAEHINELQEAILDLQAELFRQTDDDFVTAALFDLQNNTLNNSLVIETLQDSARMDLASGVNIIYLESIGSIVLASGFGASGVIKTKVMVNPTGNPYRRVRFLANDFRPFGTSIKYEISFDDVTYFEIFPGDPLPANANNEEQAQMIVRITMVSAADKGLIEELPRVDGFAFMYQDDKYSFRFLEDGLDINIEGSWDGTIIS